MATLDEITLDGKSSALVVIDIVNDFCGQGFRYTKQGWDVTPLAKMVDEHLLVFIERSKGNIPIVYVRSEYSPKQFENDPHPILNLCVSGTTGADFYRLDPKDADFVFTKNHWSAFREHETEDSTELHAWLQGNGIRKLVVSGVTLTHCIPHNIDHALRMGYEIVLASDLVASRAERILGHNGHNAMIDKYKADQKVTVVDSTRIHYLK